MRRRPYRIEEQGGQRTLVVTDSWTSQTSRAILDDGIDRLQLNYALGFKSPDLALLSGAPIKHLEVLARTVADIEPIYRVAESLESLALDVATGTKLDLGRFPRLEALSCSWSCVADSITEATGLRDLHLLSYDCDDLVPLRWNGNLVKLRFKDRPRITSLEGLDSLRQLQHLHIASSPLDTVEAFSGSGVSLRQLHLESCRIRDLRPLRDQLSLRVLNVSDNGEVDSVASLEGLDHLEFLWLYESTRVVDNDLSAIADLPRLLELRMQTRRAYRPSVSDIVAACAARAEESGLDAATVFRSYT